MSHYRRTPAALPEGAAHGEDLQARLGAPAEDWFRVTIAEYTVITDPANGLPAASFAWPPPLKIRPLRPRQQ